MTRTIARAAVLVLATAPLARAADWGTWGGDAGRNMVSAETGVPTDFSFGKPKAGTEEIDPATTKHVKWAAKLGSQSYGNPAIVGGKVFVGTNNETPRDPNRKGDRGVLYCLDEATGALQWQLTVPKLGAGKVNDWEFLGLTSSPTVAGGLVYVVTNRAEVLALDVDGLADGNDGPYVDEAKYVSDGKPTTLGRTDPDIVWRYDLREELGVFPHNATSSSVLVVGDRLYVTTSNGVDWSHVNLPAPMAPALIVLDRKTGALLGEENSGISQRTMHSNWSSPMLVPGKGPLVFGAGDGFLYGFSPEPVLDAEGLMALKELWKLDGNPERYRTKDGKPIKYATAPGPSEFIATPVFADGLVYAAIGQDPEHGSGLGQLTAVKPDGTPVWRWDGIGRSISTVAVTGGLLFASEFDGQLHCLDAKTGKVHWTHDTKAHIWGSPYVVDGKVLLGNEDGVLTILAAEKTMKVLGKVEARAPIYSTPVMANGVLYVATQTHLFAVQADGARK